MKEKKRGGLDGWVDGWIDGWMDGCLWWWSRSTYRRACLAPSILHMSPQDQNKWNWWSSSPLPLLACTHESIRPSHTHKRKNDIPQGDEARAREALAEMKRGFSIDPDVISYTTVIQACGRVSMYVRFFVVVVVVVFCVCFFGLRFGWRVLFVPGYHAHTRVSVLHPSLFDPSIQPPCMHTPPTTMTKNQD